MKKILLLFSVLIVDLLHAQFPGGNNKDMAKAMKDIRGKVYGKIVNAKTKKPVEFTSMPRLGRLVAEIEKAI